MEYTSLKMIKKKINPKRNTSVLFLMIGDWPTELVLILYAIGINIVLLPADKGSSVVGTHSTLLHSHG